MINNSNKKGTSYLVQPRINLHGNVPINQKKILVPVINMYRCMELFLTLLRLFSYMYEHSNNMENLSDELIVLIERPLIRTT